MYRLNVEIILSLIIEHLISEIILQFQTILLFQCSEIQINI